MLRFIGGTEALPILRDRLPHASAAAFAHAARQLVELLLQLEHGGLA
jgi:hypothetical protein